MDLLEISRKAGSAFGGKKLLKISIATAIFAAPAFVLAAAYVPSNSGTQYKMMQPISGSSGEDNIAVKPCNMMAGAVDYPCGGNVMYKNFGSDGFHKGAAASFALMFVVTVALVWVILLEVIALLWHHIKKHKNH